MRRKTPKSHSFTILGLLMIMIGLGSYLLFEESRSRQALPTTTNTASSNYSTLTVSNPNGLSQIVGEQSSQMVQDPNTNLQSAEGADVYGQFDAAGPQAVQPQPTQ